MGYDTLGEAQRASDELFYPGSRWRKTVEDKSFIVELLEDGKLSEWEDGNPDLTWTGQYTTGAHYEPPAWVPHLQLWIGEYQTRITALNEQAPHGYEYTQAELFALPPEDRRAVETSGYPGPFRSVSIEPSSPTT